jgi:two-component system sensor histidine kinase QseC
MSLLDRLRPRSLQGRLLGLTLGWVVAVWLLTFVITWVDMRHELDELLDGHLAQAAALLVAQQASDLSEDDPPVDAPQLHPYAPRVVFQVWHEGRLAMRSAEAPAGSLAPPGRPDADGFYTLRLDGTEWRMIAAHGKDNDVRVYVGEQRASRAEILRAVLIGMLGPMLLGIPVLALAAGWAIRRGMAPLRELGLSLEARDPSALAPLALDHAPSDLQPVMRELNHLFERIGGLIDAERRFTADAAHELRTPIAAIRAQAQVAQAERDDGLRQHALQATLDGCDRASRLVQQLLTLARLDTTDAPRHAPIDLAALTRQSVAELAPSALDKAQDISLDAEELCPVAADPVLLAVLVRNLVDNAIRYSPEGAQVQVQVRAVDQAVQLTVNDSGPGLAPADLARLGERFFRVLGSGAAGSGLGWSIVQRIAQAQRASLRAERSSTLGGLCVTVRWPLSGVPGSAAASGSLSD